MSRIVVFPHTKIFVKGITVGPSSRVWEMVKALQRKGHRVSVAEKDRRKSEVKDKIKFVPWNKELLKNVSKSYDVALTQIWCSDNEFLDDIGNIPLAVDVSAPILIELSDYFSTTYSSITSHQIEHYIDDILIPSSLILSRGDFFVCANESQKHYYQGVLNVLGRLSPYTYERELIGVVPFGIPKDRPKHTRELFKGITDRKSRVILWPGAFFPWFDPLIAIDAMKIVSKKVPEAKLVFVGSLNPRAPRSFTYKSAKKAKEKARREGLLNKSVFFVDWLPYEERGNMYLESEFAVVTSKGGLEAELAYRTRIIDCLWGGLPVICTEGDLVSEIIEREGLGIVVKANDSRMLAEKIIALLEDKTGLENISKKINRFTQKELGWDRVIEPLHQFCNNPEIDKQRGKVTPFTVLQEKEELIRGYRNRIEELRGSIKEKIDTIKDKSDVIRRQDREMQKRERAVNKILKDRDKEIKKREKVIEEQNVGMEKLDERMTAEIEKRDKVIEEQGEEMKKLGERMTAEIEKRDRVIERQGKEMKVEIDRRNGVIEEQGEEMKKLGERMTAEMEKRDKTIERQGREMKVEVEKRDRIIERQGEEIRAEIEKRDKVIEEQGEEMKKLGERMTAEIEKRDKVIERRGREMKVEVEKRDGIIGRQGEEMRAEVGKRDKVIEEQGEEMKKLGERMTAEIEKRDRVIERQGEEMRKLGERMTAEIEKRDKVIKEKDKQLQEIFESRGWRFLTAVHNVKKKLGLVKE